MRTRTALLTVFLAAALAHVALAADAKAFIALTPADIDVVKLLPPPPEDGSAAQEAELDDLRRIEKERTPERLAQARFDDAHEDATAYAALLGPKFDLAQLPATHALLDIVDNDQAVAATLAKKAFHRHRPWMFDDTLVGCDRGKKVDPLTSYPSGHATLGYAMAVVLADLIPAKAPAIMTRAADYAYSREVCEVHFPSDTAASQALGTVVGVLLLRSPALQPRIAAARAELAAAGLE